MESLWRNFSASIIDLAKNEKWGRDIPHGCKVSWIRITTPYPSLGSSIPWVVGRHSIDVLNMYPDPLLPKLWYHRQLSYQLTAGSWHWHFDTFHSLWKCAEKWTERSLNVAWLQLKQHCRYNRNLSQAVASSLPINGSCAFIVLQFLQ